LSSRLLTIEKIESRWLLAALFGDTTTIVEAETIASRDLVAGDLDSDGDLDLALASGSQVSWFENSGGSGDYRGPRIVGFTPGLAVSVQVADLDGDGDLDLILAEYNDDRLSWYENSDGQGNFSPAETIATSASFLRSVLTIDFDRDEDIDLLTVSTNDGKLYEHENQDGQGHFSEGRSVYDTITRIGTSVLSATDLNGDGYDDILLGAALDVSWHTRDAFAWRHIVVGANKRSSPVAVASGDLDRDGDSDVVYAATDNDFVSWYRNSGTGRFSDPILLPSALKGPVTLGVGDFDGDKDLDIVAASTSDDRVVWYQNTDGQGTFSSDRLIYDNANATEAIVVEDFDGDRDPDIAIATRGDGTVVWFQNDGKGNFAHPIVIAPALNDPDSSVAADLDGDGDLDVLSTSRKDVMVAWYENLDGLGTFGRQREIDSDGDSFAPGTSQEFRAIAVDLDSDGDQDVITASAYHNRVSWYQNLDGRGGFGQEIVITELAPYATFVDATDLDRDGDVDLVYGHQQGLGLAWLENTLAEQFERRVISSLASGTRYVQFSDINTDGHEDVVTIQSFRTGEHGIFWYQHVGDGQFVIINMIAFPVTDPRTVSLADVDGDRDPDVLVAGANSVTWYANDGGTFASPQVITDRSLVATWVDVADVDADGDLDVLSSSYEDDKIAWYENLDARGTFGRHQRIIDRAVGGAVFVLAADLDDDGDPDVISASGRDNRVAWHRNNRTAEKLGDFNSDGSISEQDIDLLCAAIQRGERTTWFDLDGNRTIESLDLQFFLDDIGRTVPGDANLDGAFNSTDLVQIFQRGEYEDTVELNSVWSEGDWNCDGEFNSRDLVLAFAAGGYTQ
jgi:hypothetical protein